MAKISFDIKYRPQIESGEYKVETRDGRKARIIHWDLNCTSPIVAVMDAHIDLPGEIVDVFSVSGRAFDDLESPSDLFLVTPEEEPTDEEKYQLAFNKGYEQAKKETIEKACLWLKTHLCCMGSVEEIDLFNELFEKAMREEQF